MFAGQIYYRHSCGFVEFSTQTWERYLLNFYRAHVFYTFRNAGSWIKQFSRHVFNLWLGLADEAPEMSKWLLGHLNVKHLVGFSSTTVVCTFQKLNVFIVVLPSKNSSD